MSVRPRAVDAPAVAERRGQVLDQDVPVIAGAVDARVEVELGELPFLVERQDHEADGGAVAAEEGEVDAVGYGKRTEWRGTSTGGAKREHEGGFKAGQAPGGPPRQFR